MWSVGHEYAFRSGQPTAQAEAQPHRALPVEEEANPLGWLVSLLTETNDGDGVTAQGSDATVTGTAGGSARI